MFTNDSKLLCLVAVCLAVAIAGGAADAQDETATVTEPEPVRYLAYMNCGVYTVKNFWINHKSSGKETKQIRFTRDIPEPDLESKGSFGQKLKTLYSGTCLDLSKHGISAGDQVWLSFKISGGDKESCRKSKTVIFDPTSNRAKTFHSSGTTLKDNRCQADRYVTVADPETCNRTYQRFRKCRWKEGSDETDE